ncbi:MAG TPA: glutamate mutase L [Burkholderiales bacterium]
MDRNDHLDTLEGTRVAIDIGSTVIKVARIAPDGRLLTQCFHPRDFEIGIARQVESLLPSMEPHAGHGEILLCSSANGGLRVGIVTLTPRFSGAILRDQVLVAGANPVYVHSLNDAPGHTSHVDILLVAGGIDCNDAGPLEARLRRFKPQAYSHGTLVYAGNSALAPLFVQLFPDAHVIANPLANGLTSKTGSVLEAVRRAYLDDLVYKEGVSELRDNMARGIRPTPEVVNLGFFRAVRHCSSIEVIGACVLFDIGGATTDLHYTVELVRDESEEKPSAGLSVARYVFTDLGIVASRGSLMLQIRSHPRLYEFLEAASHTDIRELYGLLREGEYEPPPALLSYACLFLALDRFAHGRGPGLPTADLGKLAQMMLTGGAAQGLDEAVVSRIVRLLLPESANPPPIFIDRQYQMWVDGITWSERGAL